EGRVIKELVEIDKREAEKLVKKTTKATATVVKQAVRRRGKAVAGTVSAAPKVEISHFRTIHHI
ncbi:MAG TPA: hypothetical protein VGA56_10785, partial [Opitutaceae bacterium]